jgi:hypothetical protein
VAPLSGFPPVRIDSTIAACASVYAFIAFAVDVILHDHFEEKIAFSSSLNLQLLQIKASKTMKNTLYIKEIVK